MATATEAERDHQNNLNAAQMSGGGRGGIAAPSEGEGGGGGGDENYTMLEAIKDVWVGGFIPGKSGHLGYVEWLFEGLSSKNIKRLLAELLRQLIFNGWWVILIVVAIGGIAGVVGFLFDKIGLK